MSPSWRRVAVVAVLCAGTGCAPDGSTLFDAPRDSPLDVQVHGEETRGEIRVVDLSYRSPAGGRVPAYLVLPPPAGPRPAVVFQHQLDADRSQFLEEATALARDHGTVGLLPAAPFARPEPWLRAFDWTRENNDREVQIQAVVDLRRGIDLLARRPEVDAGRIGYVGHSYGANWGGILSGIERRVAAWVLMAGVATVTEGMFAGDEEWKDARAELGEERFRRYAESLVALDPIRYVERAAPGSILFQFGTEDEFVSRELAERFVAAAGAQQVRWYPVTHAMADPASRRDRAAFLARKLRVGAKGPA